MLTWTAAVLSAVLIGQAGCSSSGDHISFETVARGSSSIPLPPATVLVVRSPRDVASLRGQIPPTSGISLDAVAGRTLEDALSTIDFDERVAVAYFAGMSSVVMDEVSAIDQIVKDGQTVVLELESHPDEFEDDDDIVLLSFHIVVVDRAAVPAGAVVEARFGGKVVATSAP
ncbi:MAG: hypothetical protein IT303_06870 [Dehalococcoidia bacterium]|nr:hypothetical protein [Dehalococcoidia bacterium]